MSAVTRRDRHTKTELGAWSLVVARMPPTKLAAGRGAAFSRSRREVCSPNPDAHPPTVAHRCAPPARRRRPRAMPGETTYAVRHCRSHAGRPRSVEAISLEQKGHVSPISSSACVQLAHVMVCPHLVGQMEWVTLARHRRCHRSPAVAHTLPSRLAGSPEQAGGRHLATAGHAARTGRE